MKTLTLIRHAKSSWQDDSLDDFDRPLNKRGNRDAPMMGKRLAKREQQPDLIVSSPALRAIDTAKSIAYEISYNIDDIVEQADLYHASDEDILGIVQHLDNAKNDVWLVGHNPGLEEFIEKISGDDLGKFPTCGVCTVQFTKDEWSQLDWGNGTTLDYDYPKKLE